MKCETLISKIPYIIQQQGEEEIIKKAMQLKHCTFHLGVCFAGELCPVSHSITCCLKCDSAPHNEASPEDLKIIKEQGHCNEPRCFLALARYYCNTEIIPPVELIHE